jgi:hypothetical protein
MTIEPLNDTHKYLEIIRTTHYGLAQTYTCHTDFVKYWEQLTSLWNSDLDLFSRVKLWMLVNKGTLIAESIPVYLDRSLCNGIILVLCQFPLSLHFQIWKEMFVVIYSTKLTFLDIIGNTYIVHPVTLTFLKIKGILWCSTFSEAYHSRD